MYAEQGLLCRLVYVVAGIQMDAVISLKLKVIVKYLYDINGNELPLLLYRNENEQKMGTEHSMVHSCIWVIAYSDLIEFDV